MRIKSRFKFSKFLVLSSLGLSKDWSGSNQRLYGKRTVKKSPTSSNGSHISDIESNFRPWHQFFQMERLHLDQNTLLKHVYASRTKTFTIDVFINREREIEFCNKTAQITSLYNCCWLSQKLFLETSDVPPSPPSSSTADSWNLLQLRDFTIMGSIFVVLLPNDEESSKTDN